MALPGRGARAASKLLSMGEVLGLNKLRHGAAVGAPGGAALGRSSAALGRMDGAAARRVSGARSGLTAPARFARRNTRTTNRAGLNAARMGLPPSPTRAAARRVTTGAVRPVAGPSASRAALGGARMGLPPSPVRRAAHVAMRPPLKKQGRGMGGKIAAAWGVGMAGSVGIGSYIGNSKNSAKGNGQLPGSQTGIYGM